MSRRDRGLLKLARGAREDQEELHMKPKEPLTINLNVDWRVLVILGIIVSLMALAFSVARAKAGSPPDANSIQAKKQASRPEPAATAIPVALPS